MEYCRRNIHFAPLGFIISENKKQILNLILSTNYYAGKTSVWLTDLVNCFRSLNS